MRTPTVPVFAEAKLIDAALIQIQTSLSASLSWLDYAFGKAQRVKELRERQSVVFPAVYAGKKEYLKVFPDSHIGNFSFFDVSDGVKIIRATRRNTELEANVGLIFWFDFRKVYPADWQQRTTENVKNEAFAALRSCVVAGSSIMITDAYDQAENIYKGYTNKEIDNQFLMRPYGGFRIDFTLKYNELSNC